MDPVLKSTLTSIATFGLGAAGSWAVAQGYITKDQAATLTTSLVTSGSVIIGGLLAWYAARQHTKTAQIQAVNTASNGVVVVPTVQAKAAGISPVEGPLK